MNVWYRLVDNTWLYIHNCNGSTFSEKSTSYVWKPLIPWFVASTCLLRLSWKCTGAGNFDLWSSLVWSSLSVCQATSTQTCSNKKTVWMHYNMTSCTSNVLIRIVSSALNSLSLPVTSHACFVNSVRIMMAAIILLVMTFLTCLPLFCV